jgi:hypothetical protein
MAERASDFSKKIVHSRVSAKAISKREWINLKGHLHSAGIELSLGCGRNRGQKGGRDKKK